MTGYSDPDIEEFCTAVASRLGLGVDKNNIGQLDQVLQRRLRHTNCDSVADYVKRFSEAPFAQAEVRELAAELTVGETFFFRYPEHFKALAEIALGERIAARRDIRQLRLLSAGCASGEEPFSLAATIRPRMSELKGWLVGILGIDIRYQLLDHAVRGRYAEWALRAVGEQERRSCFRRDGKEYVLNEDIRSMVAFEERNLIDEDPAFWKEGVFDIIFCRNVLMYFTPATVRRVVDRLARSLAPGGFLFLSPSETLRGISQEFHLRHTHGAFYYQKRLAHETVVPSVVFAPGGSSSVPAVAPDMGTAPGVAEARPDVVSQAASRIAALADRSRRQSVRNPAGPDSLQTATPNTAPEKSFQDTDAMLLEAVLLVNTAELAKAEEICRRLLAIDELHAGVHYLMAVCQEHRRDYLQAAEQDQAAIHLDPTFAMPRLHLGLLARRLGDLGTARRELTEALSLLAGELSSRILLFGGGFSREALVRFCQSQLAACGGAP